MSEILQCNLTSLEDAHNSDDGIIGVGGVQPQYLGYLSQPWRTVQSQTEIFTQASVVTAMLSEHLDSWHWQVPFSHPDSIRIRSFQCQVGAIVFAQCAAKKATHRATNQPHPIGQYGIRYQPTKTRMKWVTSPSRAISHDGRYQ